jgi:hypothetical protein
LLQAFIPKGEGDEEPESEESSDEEDDMENAHILSDMEVEEEETGRETRGM